jgi:hypothetical protein
MRNRRFAAAGQDRLPPRLFTSFPIAETGPRRTRVESAGRRGGGVVDHQLDGVAAAPGIAPQATRHPDRGAARFGEKAAERTGGGAKGDRPEPRLSQRIGQGAAQMLAADRLDVDDAHRREDEMRLGIGGAERGQRLDMANEIGRRRAGREPAVDDALGNERFAIEPVAEPLGEIQAQGVDPVGGDGEAEPRPIPSATATTQAGR